MFQGVASVTPFSYTLTEGGMLWVGWYLPVASLSVVPSAFSLPVLLWSITQGWRTESRKSADIRSLEPFFCKWIDYCKQICYNNYVKFLCFPKGNHSLSDLYSVICPLRANGTFFVFFCFLPVRSTSPMGLEGIALRSTTQSWPLGSQCTQRFTVFGCIFI